MRIYIRVSVPVLESILLYALRAAVAGRGVLVDELTLLLKDRGERSASFRLDVAGRKRVAFLAVGFELSVGGSVRISDTYELVVRGLKAEGPGAKGLLGALSRPFVNAVAMVQRKLDPFQGWTFPLGRLFPGLDPRQFRLGNAAGEVELAVDFCERPAE